MQRKFPALSPKELIRVLHKLGVPSREGKGSHIIFYDPDDERNACAVSRHRRSLSAHVVKEIAGWLESLGISEEDFLDAL